jgi:hypothetical protein
LKVIQALAKQQPSKHGVNVISVKRDTSGFVPRVVEKQLVERFITQLSS